MTAINILYWRDIPSQLVSGRGRKAEKIMLADRFQEAIDMAAMRVGAHGTDAYLADWRKGDAEDFEGDLAAALHRLKADIENRYDAAVLEKLIKSGGREDKNG